MRKIIALAFSAWVLSLPCFAQNPNLDFTYALKAYNLTTLERKSEVRRTGNSDTGIIVENNELQLFRPTLAFQAKNKKGNIHEFELTRLEIGRQKDQESLSYQPGKDPIPLAGGKLTSTSIAVRYEYIRTFAKKQNSRFMPSLGFAIMPYYQRAHFTPIMSTFYANITTYVGAKGFLIPRINYSLSKRVYLDLNVPVCVVDAHVAMQRAQDPTLPAARQKSSTTNIDIPSEFFSLRLGVGVRI